MSKTWSWFDEVSNFKPLSEWIDERNNYGEKRKIAYGLIGEKAHILCYIQRNDKIRVISLRKANHREIKNYGT